MLVVSWLSIALMGGAWIGGMFYDFSIDADRLRDEHYTAQKDLVQTEVKRAGDIIRAIRRDSLDALWKQLSERVDRAMVVGNGIAASGGGTASVDDIAEGIVKALSPRDADSSGLYVFHDDTVFLISPFPQQLDRDYAVGQLKSSLDRIRNGQRQIIVISSDATEHYTMMLKIESSSKWPIRIVAGVSLEMAEEGIKKSTIGLLEKVRFGEDGYLFGGTWSGIAVLGPGKGKNMWEVVGADGVKIVQRLVAASRNGGGFVSYVMPVIEGSRSTKKISYALPIDDWEWYIGGGLYVDDIESIIDENREALKEQVLYRVGLIGAGVFGLSLLAFVISQFMSRRIKTNTREFIEVWNKASAKGVLVEEKNFPYAEFKELATTANYMIGDRVAAEKLATESAAQFKSLVSNLPGVVYQCSADEDWTFEFISPSVKEITGYAHTDFTDRLRSFASILDPNDEDWVNRALIDDVARNVPYSLEYRIIRRDGEVRWVFERGQARRGKDDSIVSLDGVIIDITERRKAEDEHYTHIHFLETMERIDRDVRRSDTMEAMLSEVMETIRNAFGADRGWLLYPCDPNADHFKVPIERNLPEYPGAGTGHQMIPIDADTQFVFSTAIEASGPVAFDPSTELKIPDNTVKLFHVKSQLVAAIYPRTGKPWLMGLHQCRNARSWTSNEHQLFKEASRRVADALSNVLMYKELRDNEEKFRMFSEQTMLGICVVQDNLVKFANKAYCDIFEVSVEEMLALPPAGFLKFVHPDDQKFLMEQAKIKQSGVGTPVHTYSWRAITATGRMRWVEIHSKTIVLDGRNADLISLQDITDLKNARDILEREVDERTEALFIKEAELDEAYSRLTMLDELKSSFLTTVSHDFRTPLTSVLGYSRLVRRDLEKLFGSVDNDAMKERITSNLGVLESEAQRLESQIEEFMDLTAIKARTAVWNDADVDSAQLLQGEAERYAQLAEAKPEIEFSISIEDSLPRMHIDPDRLRQVASSILGNALIFTNRGSISVTAVHQAGEGIRFSVVDTGKGIPDTELEAVFEPFHQVELGYTLVDDIKGSGLGLALSQGIVEHYGGSVAVESEVGKGSTFTVVLPESLIVD